MIAYITHMHTRNAYPAAQSLDLSAKPALALARRGSHGRRALLLANDDILIGVSDRGMAGSDGVHWAIAVGRIFHGVAGQQMAAWRKSCTNCGTPSEWNFSGRNVLIANVLHGHRQRVLYNTYVVVLRLRAVWSRWMLAHCTMHDTMHRTDA